MSHYDYTLAAQAAPHVVYQAAPPPPQYAPQQASAVLHHAPPPMPAAPAVPHTAQPAYRPHQHQHQDPREAMMRPPPQPMHGRAMSPPPPPFSGDARPPPFAHGPSMQASGVQPAAAAAPGGPSQAPVQMYSSQPAGRTPWHHTAPPPPAPAPVIQPAPLEHQQRPPMATAPVYDRQALAPPQYQQALQHPQQQHCPLPFQQQAHQQQQQFSQQHSSPMVESPLPTFGELSVQEPEGRGAEWSIVADRFKTRMCRTWEQGGECQYMTRCMFAHGPSDLRTTEQNVADGLLTVEAVKQFQRRAVAARSGPPPAYTPTAPAALVLSPNGNSPHTAPPPQPHHSHVALPPPFSAGNTAPGYAVSHPPSPPLPRTQPQTPSATSSQSQLFVPSRESPPLRHHTPTHECHGPYDAMPTQHAFAPPPFEEMPHSHGENFPHGDGIPHAHHGHGHVHAPHGGAPPPTCHFHDHDHHHDATVALPAPACPPPHDGGYAAAVAAPSPASSAGYAGPPARPSMAGAAPAKAMPALVHPRQSTASSTYAAYPSQPSQAGGSLTSTDGSHSVASRPGSGRRGPSVHSAHTHRSRSGRAVDPDASGSAPWQGSFGDSRPDEWQPEH